jgi:hypothetical protein
MDMPGREMLCAGLVAAQLLMQKLIYFIFDTKLVKNLTMF